MLKPTLLLSGLVIALGCSPASALDETGVVAETIAARRGLMNQLTSLQTLIDTRLAASDYSPELYDLGQTAAASLDGFAMLLPAETNLLGGAPAVEGVQTTAAAQVWDDLPAFQKLLRDTAAHARAAAEAADIAAFEVEWNKVAQNCASCHAAYVIFDPFSGLN